MARFKALKNDQVTFDRCISAIRKACSSELWLDSFIESSMNKHAIDSGHNVLLHWWKSFQQTDIAFMYVNRYTNEAAFIYEDSTGRYITISEQNKGVAHVYRSNGFPESLINEIEGSSYEQLYDIIDNKLFKFINLDDFELEISYKDNI